jgi:hypothetical protein
MRLQKAKLVYLREVRFGSWLRENVLARAESGAVAVRLAGFPLTIAESAPLASYSRYEGSEARDSTRNIARIVTCSSPQ